MARIVVGDAELQAKKEARQNTPDRSTDDLLDDLRGAFIREVADITAASLLGPLKDELFEKALRLNTALLAQKREERQQGVPAVTDPGAVPMRDLDRIIASGTPTEPSDPIKS